MYRIILSIGNFHLYSYGLMQAIAYVAGLIVAIRLARKSGIEQDRIADLAMWIIIGAVIGARAWFVIENFHFYKDNLLSIIKIWEGGMVFYGGLIGGFTAGLIYVRKNKIDVLKAGDIMFPGFALGISIGRIGCFLNGCCYGRISDHCSIAFPAKDYPPPYYDQLTQGLIERTAHHSLPVIPTQLFASGAAFLIFGILLLLYKKKPFDGFIFFLFFVLYGIDRFLIDFLRYYSPDAMKLGVLSLSQYTSIVMFIFGAAMLFFFYRKSKAETSEMKQ